MIIAQCAIQLRCHHTCFLQLSGYNLAFFQSENTLNHRFYVAMRLLPMGASQSDVLISQIDMLKSKVSCANMFLLLLSPTESTLERGWPRPLLALSEPHPEEKVPEMWPAVVGESFGRCVNECLSFLPLPRLLPPTHTTWDVLRRTFFLDCAPAVCK